MYNTPGVQIVWENPDETWHHPIYSNRNKIVKRFLATDCDYLMMQDDDIVAWHNPAELVFAAKDIIGCPAKVRTNKGTLDWVAYVHHDTMDGYVAVDMGRAPSDADVVAVDIVGTGLICIARRVLEDPRMKAPFMVENDEDGVLTWGTDFAFCKRARACGYEVFTTPHRVCEHYKEFGLLQMDGYDNSDFRDDSNYPYGIAWGGWAPLQKDWHFIRRAMDEYGVKTVLEFGSGLSSLLMSERVSVVSYETSDEWAANIRAKAGDRKSLQIVPWDGTEPPPLLAQRGPFDMVFIDGPPSKVNGGVGREASYAAAAASGAPIIITHDSGRPEEMRWAKKYLWGRYEVAAREGNHQQRCELWRLVTEK
jgi:hypothetical protein